MFHQIVSSLSMTPQASSQLTFYARRLKQESITRFFSAIAATLLVALQILTVVSPASASNAASDNDLVSGGFSTKADLLTTYDKNAGLQKIYLAFGVTRADIASSKTVMTTINSRQDGNSLFSVGHHPVAGCSPDTRLDVFPSSNGSGTVYYHRLSCFDTGSNRTTGSTYKALVGKRASDGGFFAIMAVCGNIVVKTVPPTPSYTCTGLTGSPLTGQVPLTVNFTANAKTVGTAKIASYVYDFGDATPRFTAPSSTTTNTVRHAYTKPGTYTATVSVSDTATHTLKTAAACKVTVRASAVPTPTPTPSCKPGIPVGSPLCNPPALACVGISANPASGTAPLAITFTGTGTAKNQTITDYIYDFGDGSKATTKSGTATHIYKNDGSYTATVTVKGSTGTVAPLIEACKLTVNVSALPPAFVQEKAAINKTQNVDATKHPANAGDVIVYSLITKNTGGTAGETVPTDDVADILEYADITDLGGGTMNGKTISWPADTIAAGKAVTHNFTVQVKNPIPVTTTGISNPRSFDLKMENVFGTSVTVDVVPPPSKVIEVASQTMPETGPGESILLMFIVGGMVFFFYLRNRQLVTEIKLLRNEYQGDATHVG
jgi:PKD repeat protein